MLPTRSGSGVVRAADHEPADPSGRERIENDLASMVERDRHHPSDRRVGNRERSVGLRPGRQSRAPGVAAQLYHRMKASAPDRLIVDNSPCAPNFHIETDIEDYHFYAVIPEMRDRWDGFLEAFAARADFTFSPHGDAAGPGAEPLVVSEFGAWGLPDLSDFGRDGEPWWFESGQEWADGAAYVHGAEERFRLWHLDKVFGDWEGLCDETQRRQFETMRYQIETMRSPPRNRRRTSLTELSDVHWEANGLLDMVGSTREASRTDLRSERIARTIIAATIGPRSGTVATALGATRPSSTTARPRIGSRRERAATSRRGRGDRRNLAPGRHTATASIPSRSTARWTGQPTLADVQCSSIELTERTVGRTTEQLWSCHPRSVRRLDRAADRRH